jgi:hypothetical protein
MYSQTVCELAYTGWCKSLHTLEMKTRMNVFSYDFAYNLINFNVCPYKYLYRYMHTYTFMLSIQNSRLPRWYHFAVCNGQCFLTFALPYISCIVEHVINKIRLKWRFLYKCLVSSFNFRFCPVAFHISIFMPSNAFSRIKIILFIFSILHIFNFLLECVVLPRGVLC